jgi:hypothetical protein
MRLLYRIPAAPEVQPGLKLRLRETGTEEWMVKQTFTTCPDVPPVVATKLSTKALKLAFDAF